MSSRPLHAVVLPRSSGGGRLLELLAAALDGTGPAILPLDPSLPQGMLDSLITALGAATIETPEGTQPTTLAGRGAHRTSDTAGSGALGVADDVAVVLATSGSTGTPKGAELTAAALTASASASLARLGAAPGERWLCCLPPHHISGLGVLVRSLLAGSMPVIAERADADLIAGDRGLASGCSYVSLVPAQLRRLLDAGAPVESFRGILLGGAAIPEGMLAEATARGARVITTYGMTETAGGCVYDGLPLDGVEVATGTDGRVMIRGPVLFSRYRHAPRLTAASFSDDWFVTSDLGVVRADGRLVIRGRADDVINSGGEKVVAAEVEQVLRACPLVRDAVVVGTPDPDWGERVTAMIVAARPDEPPALAELRTYIAGRLPRYAAPRAMLVVNELPMLASGKPDRQLIRDIALEQER